MVSLSQLKKNSERNLNKIRKEAKREESGGRGNSDDRFWRIDRNKDGNAFAIIRFLPVPEVDSDNDEALEWVKTFSHGFQNKETGRWYIENSLTTIGQQDAISELNRSLWNSGSEADKKQAQAQKRKLKYISNIYVVKDPNNPDNEGKVFLYSYGKKIFKKIMDIMNPPEEFDEEPGDPFNFWEGRDFKLKVTTVDGWPNYDNSSWGDVEPIHDKDGNELSDEEIEEIYKSEHSLLWFVDPNNSELFKTPEALEERLNNVLGKNSSGSSSGGSSKKQEKKEEKKKSPLEKPSGQKGEKQEKKEEASSDDGDEDDIDIDSILNDLD